MSQMKQLLTTIDYIICLVLALAFTAAPYYISNGICDITFGYILTTIVTFILFLFTTYGIRKFLSQYEWNKTQKIPRLMMHFEKLLSKKHSILYISIIILACWIIPLILLYPGTLINDTWGQLQQFIYFTSGNGGLSDHHPIFDTMVMGAIIVPLSKITGRWHVLIFIYVLLQAILTSLAFANTVNYVYKHLNLGIKLSTGLLLTYCILPVFPVAVQTVSKDALHSWAFVFFVIYYIEIIRTKGEAINDKGFLIKLSVIVLYCCLTKKVGFYVIFLSLLAVLIFQKNNRKYVMVPIICSIVLMNILMPIIRTNLQVSPGGKQEMFSLPFQMTARYVKYYGYDITAEEYKVIDKVLTMEDLADRYDPTDADPVKEYYQKGEDKDYVEYIKVWFSQGLRHPSVYLSAFNSMLAGWFSWYEYDPLMNYDCRNQHDTAIIPEWVPIRGFTDGTAAAYQEMYHNLYKIPILQIFLSYGFYASLLPAFAVCTVLRKWENKEIKYWLAVLPTLLALIMGCWLAPVSYQLEGKRYLYPIVYTLPILMAWCIYIYKTNKCTMPILTDALKTV